MSELSPPISVLLKRFKSGDHEALAELVAEYWAGLVNFARSRLKDRPLRGSDEEDVVQSALVAFVGEVRARRLDAIEHRDELLAWLTTVVAHKAVDRIRSERAARHGGGRLASLTEKEALIEDSSLGAPSKLAVKEVYERYVDALPGEQRAFAELHLAGWTQQEIAIKLGCVRWTVMRKLARIRDEWQRIARASGDLTDEDQP